MRPSNNKPMASKRTKAQWEAWAADNTIAPILESFRLAYEACEGGDTLTDVLIRYDITAAGMMDALRPVDKEAHRHMIELAFDSHARGVPLSVALRSVAAAMQELVDETWEQEGKQQ